MAATAPWPGPRWLLVLFGGAVAYSPCDKLADDYIGATVEAYLKEPKPSGQERVPTFNGTLGHGLALVDDLVEDGFKIGCIASHFDVTQLLLSSYIPLSLTAPFVENIFPATTSPRLHRVAMGLVWIMKAAIAISVPLRYYTKCDEYGDALGDWIQASLEGFLGTATGGWPQWLL